MSSNASRLPHQQVIASLACSCRFTVAWIFRVSTGKSASSLQRASASTSSAIKSLVVPCHQSHQRSSNILVVDGSNARMLTTLRERLVRNGMPAVTPVETISPQKPKDTKSLWKRAVSCATEHQAAQARRSMCLETHKVTDSFVELDIVGSTDPTAVPSTHAAFRHLRQRWIDDMQATEMPERHSSGNNGTGSKHRHSLPGRKMSYDATEIHDDSLTSIDASRTSNGDKHTQQPSLTNGPKFAIAELPGSCSWKKYTMQLTADTGNRGIGVPESSHPEVTCSRVFCSNPSFKQRMRQDQKDSSADVHSPVRDSSDIQCATTKKRPWSAFSKIGHVTSTHQTISEGIEPRLSYHERLRQKQTVGVLDRPAQRRPASAKARRQGGEVRMATRPWSASVTESRPRSAYTILAQAGKLGMHVSHVQHGCRSHLSSARMRRPSSGKQCGSYSSSNAIKGSAGSSLYTSVTGWRH